jgi:hypothetical protein
VAMQIWWDRGAIVMASGRLWKRRQTLERIPGAAAVMAPKERTGEQAKRISPASAGRVASEAAAAPGTETKPGRGIQSSGEADPGAGQRTGAAR